jgi:hypothetical protein
VTKHPTKKDKPAKKMGRPRKELPSDWEGILAVYLKRNPVASLPQIARAFGVGRSTLDRWRAESDEFSTALDAARHDGLMPVDAAMLQAAVEDRSVGAATLLYRKVPGALDAQHESTPQGAPQIVINVAAVPQDHVQRIREIRGEAEREAPNTLPDRNPEADVPLRPGSRFVPDVPGITIEYTPQDEDE